MSEELVITTILQYGTYEENNNDMEDRHRRMKDEATLATEQDIQEFRKNLEEMGDEENTNSEQQMIKYMIEIINTFFTEILPTETTYQKDDVTWENVGENTLWITGGMTWGDEPSESTQIFELIKALPRKIRMAGAFK